MILAAFLALLSAGASSQEDVSLSVSFRGLKLNALLQWQTVPLSGAFEVLAGDKALGQIYANATQEQLDSGLQQTLAVSREDAQAGLALRPVAETMPEAYVIADTIPVAWNGENALRADVFAYAREGLFTLANTLPGGQPAGSANFDVLNADGQAILSFATDSQGGYRAQAALPAGTYTLRQTLAPEGTLPAEDNSFAIIPYTGTEDTVAALAVVNPPVPVQDHLAGFETVETTPAGDLYANTQTASLRLAVQKDAGNTSPLLSYSADIGNLVLLDGAGNTLADQAGKDFKSLTATWGAQDVKASVLLYDANGAAIGGERRLASGQSLDIGGQNVSSIRIIYGSEAENAAVPAGFAPGEIKLEFSLAKRVPDAALPSAAMAAVTVNTAWQYQYEGRDGNPITARGESGAKEARVQVLDSRAAINVTASALDGGRASVTLRHLGGPALVPLKAAVQLPDGWRVTDGGISLPGTAVSHGEQADILFLSLENGLAAGQEQTVEFSAACGAAAGEGRAFILSSTGVAPTLDNPLGLVVRGDTTEGCPIADFYFGLAQPGTYALCTAAAQNKTETALSLQMLGFSWASGEDILPEYGDGTLLLASNGTSPALHVIVLPQGITLRDKPSGQAMVTNDAAPGPDSIWLPSAEYAGDLAQVTAVGIENGQSVQLPVQATIGAGTVHISSISRTYGADKSSFIDSQGSLRLEIGRTAGLTGILFDDANGSGQYDEGETGAAGQLVLWRSNGGSGCHAYTNTQGTFDFSGAAAASKVGDLYVQLPAGTSTAAAAGPGGLYPAGQADLGASSRAAIAYTRQCSLYGRVFLAEGGSGLAGVDVTLLSGGKTVNSAVTDEQGAYRFNGMMPGDYQITLKLSDSDAAKAGFSPADGYVQSSGQAAALPAVTVPYGGEASQDAPVRQYGSVEILVQGDGGALGSAALYQGETLVREIAPGENGGFAITGLFSGDYSLALQVPDGQAVRLTGTEAWQKGSASLSLSVPAGEQRQQVLEAASLGSLTVTMSGTGIAGAQVALSGPESAQGALDDAGQCAFANLLPGMYQISVQLPSSVLSDPSGAWQLAKGESGATASLSVEVVSGQAAAAQAANWLQAASVAGSIYMDDNRSGQPEEGDQLLSGASVELLMDQGGAWTSVSTMQTGGDGQYRFEGLVPGQYRLSFTLPAGKALENPAAAEPFVLESGQAVQMNAAVVSPATLQVSAFWDSSNDGIRGIYERPVEGTLVEVFPAEGGETPVAQGTTGADGLLVIQSIAPGSYTLRFTLPEGYWLSQKGDMVALDRNTVPIADSRQGITDVFTIAEGQLLGFGVGAIKTATISGRVWLDEQEDGVMAEDESGLAGCLVTMAGSKNGFNYAFTTDDTGLYAMTVRPDTYTFAIQGPQGMIFTRFSATGGVKRSIFTDEGLGKGERRFEFVSGSSETDINIGYVQQSILTGLAYLDANYNGMRDEGEQPLEGVALELSKSVSGKAMGSAVTGADGAFRFEALRSGSYYLRAVLPATGIVFSCVPKQGQPYENLFAQVKDKLENTVSIDIGSREEHAAGLGAVVPAGLSGSIFLDANYNGMLDQGEQTVPGLAVRLMEPDGTVAASTVTNENGRYDFTGLMPMTYTLSADKPADYMFTKHGEGPGRSYVVTPSKYEGTTEEVLVAMGQQVENVHAGLIRPGSVAGTVFGDANDDGLLSGGEAGFAGVQVNLVSSDGQQVKSMATGADGAFAFEDLFPGSYSLTYELPKDTVFAVKTAGGSEIAGEGATASGDAFDLAMGETYQAPLCGAVALGHISGTAFHDTNANGAFEEEEGLLAGVQLKLTMTKTGQEAVSVTTGEDGAFLLAGLRPGAYTLDVTLPSGMIYGHAGEGALVWDVLSENAALNVDVAMGQALENRMIGAVQPASFGGHVWMDENNNGLQDEGEALVSGLALKVTDIVSGTQLASLTTGEDGGYQVPVIQPGVYELVLTLPQNTIAADMAPGENLFADGAAGTAVLSGLTILEGETVADMRAGIRQYTSILGKAWADQSGTISPLPGVQVNLYLAGDMQTPFKTAQAGEDGTYRFDQLMPGDYTIGAALPQGYLFVKPSDARLTSGEAMSIITDIVNGMGQSFHLTMGQDAGGQDVGAVQTGKLGDYAWLDENGNGLQDTGEPGIPGLTVKLYQEGLEVASVKTDAYGYYLFEGIYPMVSRVQVTMYPELLPAEQRTDFPLLASALSGYEGDVAATGDVVVFSGGRNFDCDLGFVLRDGSKMPDAIQPPPKQMWD